MSEILKFCSNKASVAEITEHLLICDAYFVPPLSNRIEIAVYAEKIEKKAERFEAWSGPVLAGLVAAYCNDFERRTVYITSVSVLREWTGKGVASRLLRQCIDYAKVSGMLEINLEAARANMAAIRLYEKNGFALSGKENKSFVSMKLHLTIHHKV